MQRASPAKYPFIMPRLAAATLYDRAECNAETIESHVFRAHNIRRHLAYLGVGSTVHMMANGNDLDPIALPDMSATPSDDTMLVRLNLMYHQLADMDAAAKKFGVGIGVYAAHCVDTYEVLNSAWPNAADVTVVVNDEQHVIGLRTQQPPQLRIV